MFDHERKKLLECGEFNYEGRKYTYPQAILKIETLIEELIRRKDVGAVYFEDIQLRQNIQAFKKLANLQGVLINLCEKNEFRYGLVSPSQWQDFCGARVKRKNERKTTEKEKQKTSKELSKQRAMELYGIETKNDNMADAILIGHYVVHNIKL